MAVDRGNYRESEDYRHCRSDWPIDTVGDCGSGVDPKGEHVTAMLFEVMKSSRWLVVTHC